ncbi:MAG: DUF2141 domain-containing protein [Bacteroidota bacterium]
MTPQFFWILTWFIFSASPVQDGEIILQISGIQAQQGGNISAGLFQEAHFPEVGKQFRGEVRPVSASKMEIYFTKIPPGAYALAVFQDVDADSELDANFLGLPTEPIGFSRDAKIRFGPPDFADAQINLQAGETLTIPINLK